MLSRRNIRIKVMHLLYSKRQDEALGYNDMKKRYSQSIEKSYDLYLFSILQLMKTARFSLVDASKRSAKHLPSEADKNFTPKLFENGLMAQLSENDSFSKLLKKRKIEPQIDNDMSRLFYTEFSKTEEYQNYINNETGTADHRAILLDLFRFCLANETYDDYIDDKFDNWIHDKSLIVGSVKKTLKALPEIDTDFYKEYYPTDETTKDFGEELLHKSNFFDKELLSIIEPALKNWESDRVAIIDLILLKLALCEMLYFPTIPTKVTINEFVDISKIYSTPKSKDFINGILDRLMKKLISEGKISKEGRGLIE